MQEDNGYSVKVPSGLARPSIHPSAQLRLQSPPSLLTISPVKSCINVLLVRNQPDCNLGLEKKCHARVGNGTKLHGDSRAKVMLPTRKQVHNTQQGVEEGVFTSLLPSTLGFPGVGRNRGAFWTEIPHFHQRIKQQARFNSPSSNAGQGRVVWKHRGPN